MNNDSQNVPGCATSEHTGRTSDDKTIRYAACIGCSDMGVACAGPNLLALTIPELKLWVNKWREHYKLSITKCAAAWDMPEGTVSRFLSSTEQDFRYASIQGIVRGIIRYGQPADQQQYNPCPATTAQIQAQVMDLEQQLVERTQECADLTARKLERANEYNERLTEQRELFEKDLTEKAKMIEFFQNLAEKRQRDLEKAEAVSQNYLSRIDAKNAQLSELNQEIRNLHGEILRISSANAQELRRTIDRVLQIYEAHAEDFRKIHFTNTDN